MPARTPSIDAMKSVGETMLEKPSMIAAPGALMAIIGGYLAWQGYTG